MAWCWATIRVGRAQELTGDRKAAEALDLPDPGVLQQRQRAAAGADEHEAGAQDVFPVTLRPQIPQAVLLAAAGDLGPVSIGALSSRVRMRNGQRAEVDVGARLTRVAATAAWGCALRHERRPLGDGVGVSLNSIPLKSGWAFSAS